MIDTMESEAIQPKKLSPEPSKVLSPELPEGISCDEQGTYEWFYRLDKLKHPVQLYSLIKVMLCTIVIVSPFVFFVALLSGNMVVDAFKCAAIAFGISGLLLLLICVIWLFLMAFVSRSLMKHVMTADSIKPLRRDDLNKAGEFVNDLPIYVDLEHSHAAREGTPVWGEGFATKFAEVRKLVAVPRHDLIKVKGFRNVSI